MKQAYGYIRVSSTKQLDGDGPERQSAKIENYIQANGHELLDTFTDATKGKNELKDRKELSKLLGKLAANPHIKIVVVERSDRLARNVMISELILAQFREIHVSVISADGGIDLTAGDDDDPQAQLMRQLLAVIAQYEKCMGNLRMRAGRERAKARGERGDGGICYGQTAKKPTMEQRAMAKEERQIIERMFACKSIGMSYRTIARDLNRNTVPRYGQEWTTKGVINIVRREERLGRAPVPSTEMILYARDRQERFRRANEKADRKGIQVDVPEVLPVIEQGVIEATTSAPATGSAPTH